MYAGKFRHLIVFDEPITRHEANGEQVIDFSPAITERAAIQPLAGHEGLLANSIAATVDTRINIYWSPNVDRVTAKWQIRHGPSCGCGITKEVIYDIEAPPQSIDLRNREMEFKVSSGEQPDAG